MRVLIVDDEDAARQRLARMLGELDVEVAGEARDGVQALALIESQRPDVVLLDIVMPEVDGLDVVRHLGEQRPLVIFQTAHDDYALAAFDHEAVDYVLKPVTLERLARALERARARLQAQAMAPALTPELLARLRAALAPSGGSNRARLLVHDGTGHRLLALADIVRFSAGQGLTRVQTARAEYLTELTLNELETRGAGEFVRPNRSELINIQAIERLLPDRDGSAVIVLRDGVKVHVSRRRSGDVRRMLEGN